MGFHTWQPHTPPNKIKYDHINNRRLWAKAHWAHSLPSLITLLRLLLIFFFLEWSELRIFFFSFLVSSESRFHTDLHIFHGVVGLAYHVHEIKRCRD